MSDLSRNWNVCPVCGKAVSDSAYQISGRDTEGRYRYWHYACRRKQHWSPPVSDASKKWVTMPSLHETEKAQVAAQELRVERDHLREQLAAAQEGISILEARIEELAVRAVQAENLALDRGKDLATARERIKALEVEIADQKRQGVAVIDSVTGCVDLLGQKARERIAALEHRQEHCRATLELTGSWLAISPQASLEWIESLGEEILAALDECAAEPLPCQERIAVLEFDYQDVVTRIEYWVQVIAERDRSIAALVEENRQATERIAALEGDLACVRSVNAENVALLEEIRAALNQTVRDALAYQQQQEAAILKLQGEIARLKVDGTGYWQERIAALEAENQRLREWARHGETCAAGWDDEGVCTCGFASAQERLR